MAMFEYESNFHMKTFKHQLATTLDKSNMIKYKNCKKKKPRICGFAWHMFIIVALVA